MDQTTQPITNQKLTIRGLQPLPANLLSGSIAKGLTLGDFLSKQCMPLTTGKCKLYATSHTKPFKFLTENRPVNEIHVQSLMESYSKDGYLFTLIYVNEKLEIIDGQHRFEAAKRKRLPVYFIVMPGWGIREVTILNVNSKNWTILDFMESHARAGNPHYVTFKEFYTSFEFDITACQLIMTGRRSAGYAASDGFRLGEMKLYDEQVKEGYQKAAMIRDLKMLHPYGWTSRSCVEAMLTLIACKGYDHAHFLGTMKAYPEFMLLEARTLRVEEYLKLFTNKYNFRKSKDRIEIGKR